MQSTRLYAVFILFSVLARCLLAQDTKFEPVGEQIPGPGLAIVNEGNCCYRTDDVKEPGPAFQAWIADIRHWRAERLIRLGYDG
jgi:gamma-glutamyl hercynylcysteine S-oxide synthase